jgi:hypothetical protein
LLRSKLIAPSPSEQLKSLETLEDHGARNNLALSLGDARTPGLPEALVRLIQRPDLRNHCGTLVHVLGFYNCSDYLPLLAHLVVEGNWEVAHEAFEIIDTLDAVDDEDAEAALALARTALATDHSDDWRHALLDELLALLD